MSNVAAPYGTYPNERPSRLQLQQEASRKASEKVLTDWIVEARNALVLAHNLHVLPANAEQTIAGLIQTCPFIPAKGFWPPVT